MKRLLFLKASLDNDNNTNMANVPLKEDKAFSLVSPRASENRYGSKMSRGFLATNTERASTA